MTKQKRKIHLERELVRLNGRLVQMNQTSDQFTKARLIYFLFALVADVVVLIQFGETVWFWVTAFLIVPFVVLVRLHRRVLETIERFELWRDWRTDQLHRLSLVWEAIPPSLEVSARFEHPFALDVDLVGTRSLLQLLDICSTQQGSENLRAMLLSDAPTIDVVKTRQQKVSELQQQPAFVGKLHLNAKRVANEDKWDGERLLSWLEEPIGVDLRPSLVILAVLAVINMGAFILSGQGVIPAWAVLPSLTLYLFLSLRQLQHTAPTFEDASFLVESLRRLSHVFYFLENQTYRNMPMIAQLSQVFKDGAKRPSTHLHTLNRILSGIGVRYNFYVAFLLNFLMPWDIYFTYRLHQEKKKLADLMPEWLAVWYELEALSALANHGYLNPESVLPTLSKEPLTFSAQQLGHPLIIDEGRVANDFNVNENGRLTLITGSNMAGKSSFLRTLGLNMQLAYAGGVVTAQTFTLSRFRLYTSIRINDSLTDGFSFFYAEVRRLQGLLQAMQTDDVPIFFLIDEIFRGTNNRERLIGSQAVVRSLVTGNGVGLVATHDLELVKLADELTAVRNMHFRDDVTDGQMVFDYTLREGPCPTTNALKIMHQAGLPVPL